MRSIRHRFTLKGVGNLPKVVPICSSEVMMAGCYRESSLASCDLHSALTLFNIRRQKIFVFCALHYSFFYVSPFTAVLSSGYCSFSTSITVTSSSFRTSSSAWPPSPFRSSGAPPRPSRHPPAGAWPCSRVSLRRPASSSFRRSSSLSAVSSS